MNNIRFQDKQSGSTLTPNFTFLKQEPAECDAKLKTEVTIGICVRNAGKYIKNAIQSIMDQDFPSQSMEIIFVDDGSDDDTLKVIRDHASKMNIRYKIFSDKWRGLGPVRQTVVENADGQYIIWVDGDTTLSKDYVSQQVAFMKQHPKAGIAVGNYFDYNNLHKLRNQNLVEFLEQASFVAMGVKHEGKPTRKLPGTCGSTYRVTALKQTGGFDKNITGAGEDLDAAYRIREAGWEIYLSTGGSLNSKNKETWAGLWNQYRWHAYGFYLVSRKHKDLERLYNMLPLTVFLSGLLRSLVAYKITNKKAVFLLPFQSVFKISAWWVGFIDGYLHFHKHRLQKK